MSSLSDGVNDDCDLWPYPHGHLSPPCWRVVINVIIQRLFLRNAVVVVGRYPWSLVSRIGVRRNVDCSFQMRIKSLSPPWYRVTVHGTAQKLFSGINGL